LRPLSKKGPKSKKTKNELEIPWGLCQKVKVESCVLFQLVFLAVLLWGFCIFIFFRQLPRSLFSTFPRAMSASPHQGQLESYGFASAPPIPVFSL